MIFVNKKVLKNLNIFSNGSCSINYLSPNSNIIFLEKDFKLAETFLKKKYFKNSGVLNNSYKYRKNLLNK